MLQDTNSVAKDNPNYEGAPFDQGAFFNIPANDGGEFVRTTAVNTDADFGIINKRRKNLKNYLECGTIPAAGTAHWDGKSFLE